MNKLEEHSFHDQALEVTQHHFLHSLKKRIRTGNCIVAIFGKSPIPIYQEINGEEDQSTILNHASPIRITEKIKKINPKDKNKNSNGKRKLVDTYSNSQIV